jgi:putrescine aminotransferase
MSPEERFADVVEKYNLHVNPYLAKLLAFAGFGIEVKGEGCTIYDHEGKAYLDCLGGYGMFALGHRHPKILDAVRRQLNLLPLSCKAFFNETTANLATKIAEIAPGDLEYSFFGNSGAEAVEGALKFAKGASQRSKIVSTVGGFHGKTLGALSTTGREKYQARYRPLLPGVEFVPYGDIAEAEKAIDTDTACFIVEPIQGEGGIQIPPDGYLKAVRDRCTSVGALLIFDEVQTGMGRTGTMFACEREGVVPDIMTLAKSLGGGVMPIGAVVGTPKVWEAIFSENPLTHSSTFGGNPLACAAGIATIDTIKEEGLVERSAQMGAILLEGLKGVQERHSDLIAGVRGRGLMIGVEFAMDEVGELAVAQMLIRGMCVAYTLNNPRVLRFEPPLIISQEQIEFAVETFEAAVKEVENVLALIA